MPFSWSDIETAFLTFSTTRRQLKSDRLRALAIASNLPSKEFSQIPTMSEAGYPAFQASTWHGLVTRAGTPAAIVIRLNTAIARILNLHEVRSTLVTAGFDIRAGTANDFVRFVRGEIEKWRKVATGANVRLD